MKHPIIRFHPFFVYILLLITACHHTKEEKKHVDVSRIDLSLKAERFEQDLFNPRSQPGFISRLKNKYGSFFDLYCNRRLPLERLIRSFSRIVFAHSLQTPAF